MDPGDDHELRLLHGRRAKIQQRRRLGKSWNRHDLVEIYERIDALEMAIYYGLQWERGQLIFQLRLRHFALLVEEAKRLLSRP